MIVSVAVSAIQGKLSIYNPGFFEYHDERYFQDEEATLEAVYSSDKSNGQVSVHEYPKAMHSSFAYSDELEDFRDGYMFDDRYDFQE